MSKELKTMGAQVADVGEAIDALEKREAREADDAELKRLAEAATPGEWESGGADDRGQAVVSMPSGLCAIVTCSCLATLEPEVDPTAAFIAAANPDTILRLLRERDEARAAVKRVRDTVGSVDEEGGVYDSPGDLADAVIDALDADQGAGEGK